MFCSFPSVQHGIIDRGGGFQKDREENVPDKKRTKPQIRRRISSLRATARFAVGRKWEEKKVQNGDCLCS